MGTRKGLIGWGVATSRSLVHYLQDCQVGLKGHRAQRGFESQLSSLAARSLPHVLREHQLDLGTLDKVFASQWLNSREVVCGTRCNKLFRLDVHSGQITHCPVMLVREPAPAGNPPGCGIHAIELNPSKTLLATGSENPKGLAVYQLPAMNPVCLGDIRGHKDGISAIAWVSDNVVASGSHDGTLALWQLDPDVFYDNIVRYNNTGIQIYSHIRPVDKVDVSSGSRFSRNHKVCALAFSSRNQELGSFFLDGKFDLWKPQNNLCRVLQITIPRFGGDACMTYCDEFSLYAVGCNAYIGFLDPRQAKGNSQLVHYMHTGFRVCSISCNRDIITLGTDNGSLIFYDVRAHKFLEYGREVYLHSSPVARRIKLKHTCSRGWIDEDIIEEHWNRRLNRIKFSVYTHCYNWPEMKLFVAGGPMIPDVHGNYAGLWS
ncbi:DDB1- and CUL4-associated factor 12-like protein 2 [Ochotona curzoniae]|uniref:DDB1- and CUL4-associated factor 12-like protein 2 n=1 Tax=Ochotona curzoniae TaxID=130825 RepID=UPI001B353DC0|nr:DDB1- and CUL4-associated factor 12-like protein 2 [Ochotona curzoniae]